MYKLCKTEQSATRQREIEKCFFEIIKGKHYEEVTITEICQKMNMPRKSFYRYFDGKDAIIQSMINHVILDYNSFCRNEANRPEQATLKSEFEMFFTFWKGKKDLLQTLDKSGLIGYLVENATSFAMSEFNDVRKYLTDSGDDDKMVAYQFLISGLMTMMISWYRGGFREPIENMSRATVKIITRPLFENLTRTE